jgi:MFS family permease
MVGSITFLVAEIIGVIIIGILADQYGRKLMLLMCLYIPVVCVYNILFQFFVSFLAFRITGCVYHYLFFICYPSLSYWIFKYGNFIFDNTGISSILQNTGSSFTWFCNGYRIM